MPGCGARRTRASRTPTALPQSPLLVALPVAGPQLDLRRVGGPGAGRIQAQARLHPGDRAVAVDVPLLVALPVAVPDDDRGAVGGAVVVGVQALVAVDRQLLARGVRPLLVALPVAVPQLRLGAVGGREVVDVQAPPRGPA